MKELVFLLEELSAQKMLEAILPRLIDPSVSVRFIVFEGKSDLESKLSGKLRGYQNPNACFLVMRDQDSEPDCRVTKQKLVDICHEAGKSDAVVRIACRELETFYLADLEAVAKGLEMAHLTALQNKKGYRAPDKECGSPSAELDKITKGIYQKVSGSQAIGLHLDINNTRSASFRNLVDGIRRLTA